MGSGTRTVSSHLSGRMHTTQCLTVPHTLQPVSEDHAPSSCFTNPQRAIVRSYNNTTKVFRYNVTSHEECSFHSAIAREVQRIHAEYESHRTVYIIDRAKRSHSFRSTVRYFVCVSVCLTTIAKRVDWLWFCEWMYLICRPSNVFICFFFSICNQNGRTVTRRVRFSS